MLLKMRKTSVMNREEEQGKITPKSCYGLYRQKTNIGNDFDMKKVTTSLFAQLVHLLPRSKFQNLVTQYKADKGSKGITTWDQFIAMLFAQLSAATSLREISSGLYACGGKLEHAGARAISKSTLAYANEHRDYRVFKAFYFVLLEILNKKLHQKNHKRLATRFSKPVYSLDSTLLVLTLSLFNWARYRRAKGGIKVHTLLNNKTLLPEVLVMTEGKVSDIKAAREIELPTNDCFLIMDRGYCDYEYFLKLEKNGTSFVTRLKDNSKTTDYKKGLIKECNKPEEKWGDYRVNFVGQQLPEEIKDHKLRVIEWWDSLTDKWFTFVTNNMELSEREIASLYKDRWEIEKFFKRLKQNLQIKTFVGTSKNAVLVQIWTAAIATLLFEGMRAMSSYHWNYSLLVWYVRLNLMAFKNFTDCLERPDIRCWEGESPPTQLCLF